LAIYIGKSRYSESNFQRDERDLGEYVDSDMESTPESDEASVDGDTDDLIELSTGSISIAGDVDA